MVGYMSETSSVIIRTSGSVGRITLNRPEALHALTEEMCLAMYEALKSWENDDRIGLVLVDHARDTRGFCAGGDIRMMAASGQGDGVDVMNFLAAEYRLNALIKRFPKPYVSIMDGVTMGGGVGISVHGSHRIATENTLFAMPECGIGLFPDVGGGWFLPRLKGEIGMWLALTGARVRGSDVKLIGVATDYVPVELVRNLVAQIESADFTFEAPQMLESIIGPRRKPVVGHFLADDLKTLNHCFAGDSVEEIMERLEADGSDWALAQIKILSERSPLTLKIAHRQLREGAAMTDFGENMKMEYRIAWRQVRDPDFHEGVRAVIIDKDHKPLWPSRNLESVSENQLNEIFSTISENELSLQ